MARSRQTFQIAFWEDEHSASRSAHLREYDNEDEARAEIARQLTVGNYALAGLYEWDAEAKDWKPPEMLTAADFPNKRRLS